MITYPDPLPFRLRVLRALTLALKQITPANGYESDLADFTVDAAVQARVFRGRPWFGADDPLPMLSVLEADFGDEISQPGRNIGPGKYTWPLMIKGFVSDDPNNPTDPAYILAADVTRCLIAQTVRTRPDDPTTSDILGIGNRGANKLLELKHAPPLCMAADDVSANAYFGLIVTLTTVEVADPYA